MGQLQCVFVRMCDLLACVSICQKCTYLQTAEPDGLCVCVCVCVRVYVCVSVSAGQCDYKASIDQVLLCTKTASVLLTLQCHLCTQAHIAHTHTHTHTNACIQTHNALGVTQPADWT